MFNQIYQTSLPFDYNKKEYMDFIKCHDMYINDKVEIDIVQFVTKYFEEIIDSYDTDLSYEKFVFNIATQDENICSVQFDYRNMVHLLGMNAAGYGNNSQNSTFFNKFCAKYSNFLTDLPITIIHKFSRLFKDWENDIITYETQRDSDSYDSLNWIRIAYKVFCLLNIGNIGDVNDCVDKTYIFTGITGYQKKKQLFILRKALSVDYDNSYILLSFNLTDDLSKPLDPESIKMVDIDPTKICRSFDYMMIKQPGELINEFKNVSCLKWMKDWSILKVDKEVKEEYK